jgi:3-hydroxyisobutyrate dehydrogenase-like beta-hydroxyacid dehydrogenase
VAVARTPHDLAERVDVVVTCVSDPAAVERVVFAPDGVLAAARPGFRYVETSTVSPALTRRIAEAFRERGADALDAPVTGSKLGAEAGTLLFMTGGRHETHAELLPVLMAMGKRAIHCGDSGQGALMKLINNAVISFLLQGLAEGMTLGRRGGLSDEIMLEVFMASAYASPFITFKGGALQRRDYDTHFSIDLLVKDQGLALDDAAARGAKMPILAAIRGLHELARQRGLGHEDIAAVVKLLEA